MSYPEPGRWRIKCSQWTGSGTRVSVLCKVLHNLPSTAKNLGKWVEHFIQNMEEVSEYL